LVPGDVPMELERRRVAALMTFTLAGWRHLGGDANIFKRHQEGRDVIQDVVVAVGFWLLVVLFFSCSLNY
jgi:hypothetical protein